MRADESLQRYSGIINKKYGYKDTCWITKQFKDVWCASPMYDWSSSDVWHANYIFQYDYNKLYDLYYMAGLKPDQMRVASPFNDYAKTKAMGYKNLTLPEGHTWESYTHFLLSTLPPRLRQNYIKKFQTSIHFWHTVGGGLEEETIKELEDHGYNIKRNGISNYTVMRNSRIVFLDKIPDHTDDIKSTKDIPSWKRMCFCILKNDHLCRFMGFGLTREQQKTVNLLKQKMYILLWMASIAIVLC